MISTHLFEMSENKQNKEVSTTQNSTSVPSVASSFGAADSGVEWNFVVNSDVKKHQRKRQEGGSKILLRSDDKYSISKLPSTANSSNKDKDIGSNTNFTTNLMSGASSGLIAKTMAAPIERVKLLLQTQKVNSDVHVRYKGMVDCFRRVYAEQGLVSFWRGNAANLMRYMPGQALTFAFKDHIKDVLSRIESTMIGSGSVSGVGDTWRSSAKNFIAAGMAGGMSLCLLYPLDMARTRLAADVGVKTSKPLLSSSSSMTNGAAGDVAKVAGASVEKRRFNGTFDCLRQIYTENGVKGLYRGMAVSVTGVVVFRALFLGGYDTAKLVLDLEDSSRNGGQLGIRFLTAQVVTVSAGTACYPIDTVRRRVMMQVSLSCRR